MKNTFIKNLALFILIFNLSSCSQEEISSQKQDSLDFSEIKIDLKKSFLGKEIKVIDYKDKTELITKINSSFNQIIVDSRELIKDKSEVSDIILNINFSDGKAIITNIVEYNIKTKEIINAHYLNPESNTYLRYPPNDIDNLDYASCPDGYTQVDSCSNVSGTEECVGSAVQSYLSDNVSGIGDCANIQVQVGTFSTKVCGRTC